MIIVYFIFVFFTDTATTDIYTYGHTLALHDALPIDFGGRRRRFGGHFARSAGGERQGGGDCDPAVVHDAISLSSTSPLKRRNAYSASVRPRHPRHNRGAPASCRLPKARAASAGPRSRPRR